VSRSSEEALKQVSSNISSGDYGAELWGKNGENKKNK
jgi:hypothetical protein